MAAGLPSGDVVYQHRRVGGRPPRGFPHSPVNLNAQMSQAIQAELAEGLFCWYSYINTLCFAGKTICKESSFHNPLPVDQGVIIFKVDISVR